MPLDYDGSVAADYPDVLRLVEERVRSERLAALKKSRSPDKEKRAKYWWRFARNAKDLYCTINRMPRVLTIAQTGNHLAFAFKSPDNVFAHTVIVIAHSTFEAFSVLQSRPHNAWAAFFAATMKDDLRYIPTDCFETFPFPAASETKADLEQTGREYYDLRASLMARHNEGLTATYNRFHDPAEGDADILKVRELHDAMDRAVLDAYCWGDIETVCGFGLDYLDFEDEDLPEDVPEQLWWPTAAEALAFAAKLPQTRRRLPWRYRWPEETRDEVLARLLELNKQRAEDERRTGKTAEKGQRSKRKKRKATRKKAAMDDRQSSFFEDA